MRYVFQAEHSVQVNVFVLILFVLPYFLVERERESERETDGNRGREGEMEIRGLWKC